MKKYLVLLICILSCQHVFAQTDFLKRFIRKMYLDKDSTRKPNFVLVPALASSPETGLEFGGASLFSFYTDTARHSITRVSNLFGYASITTKGQEKVSLNSTYWTPENKWYYTANISYYNYPFDFYGIGNNTLKANEITIEEKRTRFGGTAENLVAKNIYAGFSGGIMKYYYYSGTHYENLDFKDNPNIADHNGGSLLYGGGILVYDSRNNNTYTTKGTYINTYCNFYQGIFGNNGYTGGFFNLDFGEYFKLLKPLVIAFNLKEQSLIGGQSPFYLLPQLGNDALMRGYYTGRYRDRNLLAGQGELRYRLTDRFGIDGFLGWGEVANGSFSISALKPDIGGGLRYFFDTEKGLTMRADYGIGEQVAGESRQQGFYIALGEAF
jgi:hypothetical protein